MSELEKVYRLGEVAVWMRCSRASIYRLLKAGQLGSIKIGGTRLIAHSQLVDFIEMRKRAQWESQSEPS
jgi:excisionase family DNA binding protein